MKLITVNLKREQSVPATIQPSYENLRFDEDVNGEFMVCEWCELCSAWAIAQDLIRVILPSGNLVRTHRLCIDKTGIAYMDYFDD